MVLLLWSIDDMICMVSYQTSDYGALTILSTREPGLQVFVNHDWYSVPFVENAYIINLGDLMRRWTNDRWQSTLHRVVMPSTEQLEKRYSMAYFCNMNGDALIESLIHSTEGERGIGAISSSKYPPIRAGDHLMQKHLASMKTNGDDEEEEKEHARREEL
jgi:isopenicillin N synthase-like dioxygenase